MEVKKYNPFVVKTKLSLSLSHYLRLKGLRPWVPKLSQSPRLKLKLEVYL